jgi:hypothetical protein
MKKILFLLFLFSLSIGSFGQSVIQLERTWIIEEDGEYSFDGALIVNDSNQMVLSINTSPKMTIVPDNEGNIRLRYDGRDKILKASTIVRINYETNITQDNPPPAKSIEGTNLTSRDLQIAKKAEELKANSSLETILNLNEFVHEYITYNESYFGEIIPAKQVFSVHQGVCVEYSHLLISMANSLGFKTRYVSGYANGGVWQPHAWVEIYLPEYGYLALDPTFNQIGKLDNTHIAIAKGADQSQVFDSLYSKNEMTMSVTDTVQLINQSKAEDGLNASFSYDKQNEELNVTLINLEKEYAFAHYEISLPEEFAIEERKILLLKPNGEKSILYLVNSSSFEESRIYTIPILVSLDDSAIDGSIEVVTEEKPKTPQKEDSVSCISGFFLLLVIHLYTFHQ